MSVPTAATVPDCLNINLIIDIEIIKFWKVHMGYIDVPVANTAFMGSSNKSKDGNFPRSQGQSDDMLIGSVMKSFTILESLQKIENPTVSNIAKYLGLSDSSVYKHLATLEERGYVVKEEEDVYRPSLRFFEIGSKVNTEWLDVYEPAREALTELAIRTGENCWLMVEEEGEGVMVCNVAGEDALEPGFCQEGKRLPLYPCATGKAILAHLPEDRRSEIVENVQLTQLTDKTITDREEMYDALADVRDRGIAVNDEESQPNIRAIGAPIMGTDDTVLGAISISGPTSRLSGSYYEEELPEMLREKTNIIEIKISSY